MGRRRNDRCVDAHGAQAEERLVHRRDGLGWWGRLLRQPNEPTDEHIGTESPDGTPTHAGTGAFAGAGSVGAGAAVWRSAGRAAGTFSMMRMTGPRSID